MHRTHRGARAVFVLLLAASSVLAVSDSAHGQYFGRNKVQYENFNFKVLSTEHFDIHFYPEDNQAAYDAARMAERWYDRLSRTFDQEFTERKPIILYSDHADFQQTNVIGGFIGEGTGGVTESVKSRLIMPLTGDYASTDHVLGHEVVHVFQYDIAFAGEDTLATQFKLQLLPLWLIEGMAEYLSVGREDPHTAMWLRDALLQDEFPTIKQLTTDPRFFPYRFGQALWAYVGGRWGDEKIAEIYRYAGKRGMEFGFAKVLGVTTDSLSGMWTEAVREAYEPAMKGRAKAGEQGKRILAHDIDAGEINLAPVLSRDGNKVAFLSERDLFSIDVFIADSNTGKIDRKLISSETNPHFDALRFIDSAGSWSPDGERIAMVVFAKGNNEIVIVDTRTGKIKQNFKPTSVGAISNPAWSPDGRNIAFSGSSRGISNLYLVEVETGNIRQLTDDRYADLQPAWSPDGRFLAFVTDRGPGTDFDELTYEPMRLGLIEVGVDNVRVLAPFDFERAKHINPQFSQDGNSLYFISDCLGFSDIYRIDLETEAVFQITNVATGVSGITSLSPALTVASGNGRVLYSVFEDGKYTVYGLDADEAQGRPVSMVREILAAGAEEDGDAGEAVVEEGADVTEVIEAETVAGDEPETSDPETESDEATVVATDPAGLGNVLNPGWETVGAAEEQDAEEQAGEAEDGEDAGDDEDAAEPATVDDDGFMIHRIGGRAVAGRLPPAEDQGRVLVSDYLADPEGGLPLDDDFPIKEYKPSLQLDYIGGFAGGVAVDRFGTAIGGGATAFFSDMLSNHTLGVGLQANGGIKDIGGQVFYLNRSRRLNWGGVAGHIPFLDYFSGIRAQGDTLVVEEFRDRVFLDRASLFAAYPFSPTKRVEVSAGFTRYSFDEEVRRQFLYPNGLVSDIITENLDSRDALNLGQASLALVGDNSFFGFTSPIKGQRYRLEVEPSFGSLQFNTLLLDYRRYFLLRPFTFAARGMHLGRYGPDAEDERLSSLFIGYSTLVRGYSSGSFDPVLECDDRFGIDCGEFDRLLGSRIGVANLELRFPLIGTSQYGLINFPYLPTELSAFFDGGVAWTRDDSPEFKFETDSSDRVPVFSTGLSARVNILGALVVETFYAYPFQRPEKGAHFGVQIAPGW